MFLKTGLGSFKVIENDTIQKPGYGFLFAFHSNYGHVLYHFGDKVSYWWKIVIFHTPSTFDAPVRERGRWNFALSFVVKKLEWCGCPMGASKARGI